LVIGAATSAWPGLSAPERRRCPSCTDERYLLLRMDLRVVLRGDSACRGTPALQISRAKSQCPDGHGRPLLTPRSARTVPIAGRTGAATTLSWHMTCGPAVCPHACRTGTASRSPVGRVAPAMLRHLGDPRYRELDPRPPRYARSRYGAEAWALPPLPFGGACHQVIVAPRASTRPTCARVALAAGLLGQRGPMFGAPPSIPLPTVALATHVPSGGPQLTGTRRGPRCSRPRSQRWGRTRRSRRGGRRPPSSEASHWPMPDG
jgi:hypothetical protein